MNSSEWLQDLANEIHPMNQIHSLGVEKKARKLCDIAKEIKRLKCELAIKSEFLSSRQCPDHSGKWPRGSCLQCEIEHLKATGSYLAGEIERDHELGRLSIDSEDAAKNFREKMK